MSASQPTAQHRCYRDHPNNWVAMHGGNGVILAPDFSILHMLSSDSWEAIALAGLVLSGVAGIASGPWAAVVFTMLYGAALLSVLRSL